MLILPFNELRFNIVFRILITVYGMTGLGNLIAYMPDSRNDDKSFFKYNKYDFSFWLLTSLIFYRLGISQFQYQSLVYLTVLEIVVILFMYLHIIACKQTSLKEKRKRLKTIKEKKADEMRNKISD